MSNRFARRQIESNRQNRDAWARYAPHRARVTQLVMDALGPGDRVCVLGAGNVNDVDLLAVLEQARTVDLVDLDGDAMTDGVRRQELHGDPRVRLSTGWDLSGVLDRLSRESDLARIVDAVDGYEPPLPFDTFDVVLSVGVLTQLFQSIIDAELDPEATVAVILRLRARHLLDLTRLARLGGQAILVTDTVATSTAPHLPTLAETELEPAMAALVASGNFFTGTNAYRVAAVLEESAPFTGCVSDVTLHDPWLWAVTPDREHLTYAITWARRQ